MSMMGALRYAERDARVWAQLWHSSLVSGAVTPLLFLGAMGIGVGGMIDENTGTVEGLDYLTFVAPGLLVASSVQRVSGNSLWRVLGGHKWMGHFHGAVATPLRPGDVYAGFLAWEAALCAMNAVPFVLVAALLGGVPSAWGILAVGAAVLCTLAFAAPLAAFAGSQDSDESFAGILRLIILPLFLFSGTFFPLDNLPVGLRPVAVLTPMWHGVELARGATTGSIGLLAGLGHLAFLVAWIGLCGMWGVRTFTRKLTE